MITIKPQLQNLIDLLSDNFLENQSSMMELEFENYRYVSKFENLMVLLDRLLIDFKQLQECEIHSLLKLLTHGFIQYQTDNSFDSEEGKSFNLRLSVESKIEQALVEMAVDDIPIIRNLVGSMFTASMNVSEELLEKINQAEYADNLIGRINEKASFNEMINYFEELASTMKFESDHQIYQQVADQLNQLPADAAPMMMSALLQTTNQHTRDSAILLLMHPLEKVRNSIYPLIIDLAEQGLLNRTDQSRLIRLRNWVSEEQKNIIDQTIKKLQRSQADQLLQAENQFKMSERNLFDILISPSDIDGAMGFHVMFKNKDKYEILGLIFKQSIGIKDGFIVSGLDQENFDEVLEHANEGMPMRSIDLAQLELLTAHFLSFNLSGSQTIPVEVLLLSEYLAIEWLSPTLLTLEVVKTTVSNIKFIPEEALEEKEFIFGWASAGCLKNHKTIKAILNKEFEPHREIWLERIMVTCMSFCQSLEQIDLFLDAAIDLKNGKKMNQISLFKQIAEEILMVEEMPELLPDLDIHMLEEMLASGINLEQLSEEFAQKLQSDDNIGLLEPGWEKEQDWQHNPFMLSDSDIGNPKKWLVGKRPKRAVYQIKISLKGSKPAIWRRLLVMNTMTLQQLHSVILISMGWSGGHLYEFDHGRDRFGQPDEMSEWDIYDDSDVQLRDLIYKVKAKLGYVYDFGDHWQHQIQLEKIEPAKRKNTPPQLIKAVNACPPDDCGGVQGYYEYLKILKQPNHEEYDSLRTWMGLEDGEIFDPSYFDIECANELLSS